MTLPASRDAHLPFVGGTDSYLCRPASRASIPPTLPFHRRSRSGDSSNTRYDRWTVDLSAPRRNNRVARDHSYSRSLIMPLSTGGHSLLASSTATTTTTTATLPSVFESDDNGRLAYAHHCAPSKTLRPLSQSNNTNPSPSNGTYTLPKPPFALDSTTSSPSTTASTLNSAVTETSPVSSPQSPNSLVQAPFKNPKLNPHLTPEDSMDHPAEDVSPVRPTTSASDSAALRKGRNMKNLMINTNGISARANIDSRGAKDGLAQRPVTQSGPAPPFKPRGLPPVSESAPVSPSFIIPKIPPRRKPSKLGLTIATPESEQRAVVPPTPSFNATFANSKPAVAATTLQTIPQTPAFPPTLQNPQQEIKAASDSLVPTIASQGISIPAVTGREMRTPGLAPSGGMTLPPFASHESSPSKRFSPGSDSYRPLQDHMGLHRNRSAENTDDSAIANQTIEYVNHIPQHDLPLSQEVKSPTYPEGPACIYPPNVYLYHQPTAIEARDFDVVINVAREVTNPFEIEAEEEKARQHARNTDPVRPPKPSYRSVGVQVELLTEEYPPAQTTEEPSTATSDASFSSALDRLSISTDEDVPPTPKNSKYQPEYLHLPWEHNSKVYEEWYEICQLISERTKKGKRVLIHCQLGVSRSASLIVAYGIFLNPSLSPDEAREQAKQRSRWIDLNMHFMYELGDFKKLLAQKGVPGAENPRLGLNKLSGKPTHLSLARSKADGPMLSPVQSVPNTPLSVISPGSGPGTTPLTSEAERKVEMTGILDGGLSATEQSYIPSYLRDSADPTQTPQDEPQPSVTSFTSKPTKVNSLGEYQRLPPPSDVPVRKPSPGLKTPGFDMPGGWAATPAMSRPTSMVFPEGSNHLSPQMTHLSEHTPQQSPVSSVDHKTDGDVSSDTKPTRAPSFRRLPKMPSLPSGFANSIGSFFSLNRSASTSSRKGSLAAPSRQSSLNTRLTSGVSSDVSRSQDTSADGQTLRKPPSLPSLRSFFTGGSNESPPSKPGLSLTLDTIPQSAVGGDENTPNAEAAFAALMSPRAQEFVSTPFHRPVTSHAALASGPTVSGQLKQPGGLAGVMGSLGLRKQKSAQSLRDDSNAIDDTPRDPSGGDGNTAGALRDLGRKASTGSHKTVVHLDRRESALQDEGVRELLSPGAQERDPRSPPSHGNWGTDEKFMRNIDDVL